MNVSIGHWAAETESRRNPRSPAPVRGVSRDGVFSLSSAFKKSAYERGASCKTTDSDIPGDMQLLQSLVVDQNLQYKFQEGLQGPHSMSLFRELSGEQRLARQTLNSGDSQARTLPY